MKLAGEFLKKWILENKDEIERRAKKLHYLNYGEKPTNPPCNICIKFDTGYDGCEQYQIHQPISLEVEFDEIVDINHDEINLSNEDFDMIYDKLIEDEENQQTLFSEQQGIENIYSIKNVNRERLIRRDPTPFHKKH